MVYKGYRGGPAFSKGDPAFSRGGVVQGPIVNSYNYRMFYFPGEELPLFTDPMISQLAMMCQIKCQKFY